MYVKYIVLFSIFALHVLVPAQAADRNRINIRIFPSQVLAIATSQDIQGFESQATSKKATHNKRELLISNLYGSQITLLNERHSGNSQRKVTEPYLSPPKIIYSRNSAVVGDTIEPPHFSLNQKVSPKKLTVSQDDRIFVYLITTR